MEHRAADGTAIGVAIGGTGHWVLPGRITAGGSRAGCPVWWAMSSPWLRKPWQFFPWKLTGCPRRSTAPCMLFV